MGWEERVGEERGGHSRIEFRAGEMSGVDGMRG